MQCFELEVTPFSFVNMTLSYSSFTDSDNICCDVIIQSHRRCLLCSHRLCHSSPVLSWNRSAGTGSQFCCSVHAKLKCSKLTRFDPESLLTPACSAHEAWPQRLHTILHSYILQYYVMSNYEALLQHKTFILSPHTLWICIQKLIQSWMELNLIFQFN